jgi:hypothetical protein
MSGTYLHPTAGYIMDFGASADAEPISNQDRVYLRGLAQRVKEISQKPRQAENRELWIRHNRLEPARPMYVIYPEDGWIDLLGPEGLQLQAPFWRNYEWYLQQLIYRDREIDDDFVVEPDIYVPADHTIVDGDYGLAVQYHRMLETGAYRWDPPLKEYSDMKKLRKPRLEIDEKQEEKTRLRVNAVTDVFGDIFEVKPYLAISMAVNQPGILAGMRGIQQMMLDMCDAPGFLHEILEIITEGYLGLFKQMEDSGRLRPNTWGHYVDSGGNGYTDEFPRNIDGKPTRLSDLWGFGVAQEYSEVSPKMHYEFGFQYQNRVLGLFGINSYGCCEPYTHKMDVVKTVPRLRRVSVSPWCDTRVAAEKLGRSYIFSWKPNPAVILYEEDFSRIREYVRENLSVARDCILEIFFKDPVHLKGKEQRMKEFASLLRTEVEH